MPWVCSNPNCPQPGGYKLYMQPESLLIDSIIPRHCGRDMLCLSRTGHRSGPVYHSVTASAIRDEQGMKEAQEMLRRDVKPFQKGTT